VKQAREPTISGRLIVPFLEVWGSEPAQLKRLGRRGIGPADLVNPDLRVPCRVALELLSQAVTASGDEALGIKAGEAVDPGALDVAVLAARSCATLRDGIACALRFVDLSDESLRAQLVEEGERAVWRCWRADDANLPASNDFTLASTYMLIRACTERPVELLEVHFKHAHATSAAAYGRVFDGAPIKLGMPYNALVFRRSALDEVLTRAHSGLQIAYEARASALLRRLHAPESVADRVQQIAAAQLRLRHDGATSMTGIARELGVSVATLRRHLQREGRGFSDILEHVRRCLAEEQLCNTDMSIMEVSRSLGFSHVAAFYRAFRRWFHGITPTELRARTRDGEPSRADLLDAGSAVRA
jgi:AraC-like DNA-binding protein